MRAMKQAQPSAADAVRDENLERAVLGAFLRGVRRDEYQVPPEAFTNPLHRAINGAVENAAARFGVVDVTTVRSVLRIEKAADDAVQLAELLAAGDADLAHMDKYVTGLLGFHAKRVAIQAMEEGIRSMLDPATRADFVAAQVAATLGATSEDGCEGRGGDMVRSLRGDIAEARKAAEDPQVKPLRSFLALPFSGFKKSDNPMRGFPCRRGASALTVIAARSGIGKTAQLATILHHWVCELGMKVGLVGLEDGVRWLIERWAARDFGLDWGNIVSEAAKGEHYVFAYQVPWFPETWSRPHPQTGAPVFTLDDVLEGYEVLLDEQLLQYSGASIASPRLMAICRKWIRHGVEAIVVDHGLQVDYSPGKDERLDLAIGRGIKGLNTITVETGVPICLAWHLNRRADEDAPPTMNDVKESGYLDANAALVLGVYRQNSTGRSLCNVIKSRKSGGIGTLIELIWAGRSGMFYPKQCEAVDLRAEAQAAREARKAERAAKKAG